MATTASTAPQDPEKPARQPCIDQPAPGRGPSSSRRDGGSAPSARAGRRSVAMSRLRIRRTTSANGIAPGGDAEQQERRELHPGQIERFPFTMRPPQPLSAPSMGSPEFTVRWLLRVILDRPLRADPVTTVELCGITAP